MFGLIVWALIVLGTGGALLLIMLWLASRVKNDSERE